MNKKGFTVLEILIAILVMIVGVVGIMAMQIVAVQANSDARNNTEATNLAEHFVGLLEQEATNWVGPLDAVKSPTLDLIANNQNQWLVLTNGARNPGEVVNAHGLPKSELPTKGSNRAIYCVAVNGQWSVPNQVISGYIRVYWSKTKSQSTLGTTCGESDGDISLADMDAGTRTGIGAVTLPFSVRRGQ